MTALGAALAALLLSGCVLGPDYVKPPAVAEAAQQAPTLHRAGDAGVRLATPLNRWWQALNDPQLNQLVEQALADSPTLRAAEARLRANRALARQRRAERMPQVGATAAYVHARPPGSIQDSVDGAVEGAAQAVQQSGGEPAAQQLRDGLGRIDLDTTELYNAGFDASWEIDLFGRRRRAAEQALAEAEASQAQLADAQVQLAAEVGQVYLNYRGLQARLTLAEDNLDRARQTLALTQQRRERGADSDLQVERAATQVQQQEAQRLPLQAQAQEALDQLALMVGREPGALDALLAAPKPLPALPVEIPVDDAAALIRRRPDVRQAERELAAANAQIGQALSAYFPQVTLLGSLGMVATSPGDLNSDALTTLVAPMLRWSVFDFGRVKSQVAQARAGTDARAAAYEGKVLAALQDANGALSRFGAARRQRVVAQHAEGSATRSATLMQQRQQAGAASLIDALDVQRQRLSAQDNAIQAQVQLLVNYVALQKSLGLGWGEPSAR